MLRSRVGRRAEQGLSWPCWWGRSFIPALFAHADGDDFVLAHHSKHLYDRFPARRVGSSSQPLEPAEKARRVGRCILKRIAVATTRSQSIWPPVREVAAVTAAQEVLRSRNVVCPAYPRLQTAPRARHKLALFPYGKKPTVKSQVQSHEALASGQGAELVSRCDYAASLCCTSPAGDWINGLCRRHSRCF